LRIDFQLIGREDALVWLLPPGDNLQSDELHAKQQHPPDQPSLENAELHMQANGDLCINEAPVVHLDETTPQTSDTEPICTPAVVVESIDPTFGGVIDPVDRAVRSLDIDSIVRSHQEAIDVFRQLQPDLEARNVRAPHLLLLLAAQLELAEATKMVLDRRLGQQQRAPMDEG